MKLPHGCVFALPLVLVAGAWVGCDGGGVSADGGIAPEGGRCDHHDPLRQPFFGDTHVHTALSLDANLQGTRLRPMDAYRFARGERVGLQPHDDSGNPTREARLPRPLDFAVVTDHAEFLGHVQTCTEEGYPGYDSGDCQAYRDRPGQAFTTLNFATAAPQSSAVSPRPCPEGECAEAIGDAWQEVQSAAEAALDTSAQCEFVSFVGYEWTGNPQTKNLHRNVIFAGDQVPDSVTSYFDAAQEEGLWDRLEADCLDGLEGCDVLTIPHNSNLSSGLMFETVDGEGQPFDADYVERRARMEPLAEVFQHKGSSECYSPMGDDEACEFERMPYNSLAGANLGLEGEIFPADFVRHALLAGLQLGVDLGTNPFQYGLLASTDTHNATPGAVSEEDFKGHGGAGKNLRDSLPPGFVDEAWFNPGGLAVLWAEENTRESLFAAMRRREAYGTSGPRIQLRFFGGFEYGDDACGADDFAARGYEGGVPMGGELEARDGSPTFLVRAAMDPGTDARPGGKLSHAQIVKGWLDGDSLRTEVVHVAGAEGGTGRVNEATCERSAAGRAELCAAWTDEDYDPAQAAFYYVRVFETPSCRWTTHACNAAGVDCADAATVTEGFEPCCDEAFPRTQRERAWSSPIWMEPR